MDTCWERRQILQALGLTGAMLFHSSLAWGQQQEAMLQHALDMLASCSTTQRRQVLLPFEAKTRRDWHYIPRRRPGLPLHALNSAQQELVWALLGAGLSEQGLAKARGIITTEAILAELSGNSTYRDPTNYAVVFFGDPASGQPWSWRFEGHHLSLTFTIVPGRGVAVTPAFLGTNPAIAPPHHKQAGLQVLATEESAAFRLLESLSASQKATALLAAESFGDIVSGPGREASLQQPAGLALAAMTTAQRQQAMTLIETYVRNARPDIAQAELTRLMEAGVEAVHFAWAGSTEPGRPHYYRLHGPTLRIEYDNTQNGANHVHSVWHNPANNFGDDLLQAHYREAHPPSR